MEQRINAAQNKLNDIINESFFALTDEEKENGTNPEQKMLRYEKWYKPMVEEILGDIRNGNEEVISLVEEFDLNKDSHVKENKWYSASESFDRDVHYKLLPALYEKVQNRIKAEYDEHRIPYVILFFSESPKFPSENKVYTLMEFNKLLIEADSEFHNRKLYAKKKYGSADNYWDLERDDKLPEEDKGIQFGYDKTNFKICNVPDPKNPKEDTLSYEPSRYDIGDGNGSVFDYVRATCSHDDFIKALNLLENDLYFPGITKTQKKLVEGIVKKESKTLKENLKDSLGKLDDAQHEYKELHKKWLIEASEAERIDKALDDALNGIVDTYKESIKSVYDKALKEFSGYVINEIEKMIVSELYLPSRNAQKAMNAEDYKSYNSVDWAKLRRIWERFPANVNMTSYIKDYIKEI